MKKAIFTIERDSNKLPSSFEYETIDGTALAGKDYVYKKGTITFPDNSFSTTLEVDVNERFKNALPLDFSIKVSNVSEHNTFINQDVQCYITSQTDTDILTWNTFFDRMFSPKYWTIDSQSTESCSIISNGDSFTAYMTNRTVAGLGGIIWNTKDLYDHKGLGYVEHRNLSKEKLWFQLTLGENVPGFNDEALAPTLTLTLLDGTIHYIVLSHYAENISADGKSATVKLDFSQLKSGNDNEIRVDTTQVDQFFFSLISNQYIDQEEVTPHSNIDLNLTFTLLQPDTGYSLMFVNNLNVPAHDIRMCTSYDDMYNLTPERIVDNIYRLGYRNMINHYNGMSHYYEYSDNNGTWALNRTTYLNKSTEQWFINFLVQASKYGYQVINSLSFELMSTVCPVEWVQHDWNDNLAVTGYVPPSYVLSPSIEDGMTYIQGVINKVASLCKSGGVDIIIQIGEPWWWYNTATKMPTVFDYPTKLAFNQTTGLYAADIGTINNYKTGTPYDEYRAFLSKTLGERVVKFSKDTKTAYPEAKVTLLPFLPSIIGNGMMESINFPKDYYTPTNFDFYCSECYDWLIEGQMEKSFDAINIPKDELKFDYNKIHYLAGFVPDEKLAPLYGFDPDSDYRPYLWKMIIGNVILNEQKFPGLYQYIWAYPQIMHDSITVHNSQSQVFHMGNNTLLAYLKDTPFQ